MPNFDPGEHTAAEVVEHLAGTRSGRERDRILTAENKGQGRVSIFNENASFDRDARRDASGRILNPWETEPEAQADAVDQEALAENEAALAAQQQQSSADPNPVPQGGEDEPDED